MPNRPYQDDIIRTVGMMFADGRRRLTIQCPTGSGKTRIAVQLVAKMGSRRVLYTVPSTEIFEQTSEKLIELGVQHIKLEAGTKPDPYGHSVMLAMSQTLNRRTSSSMFDTWEPDVIIIDEIHKLIEQHRNISTMWKCPIIGMTASPVRLDGKNLSDITPYLLVGPTIKQLQRQNYLVPCITYPAPAPDIKGVKVSKGDYDIVELQDAYFKQGVLQVVPDHWKLRALGRRTITFAPGVEASKMLVKVYNLRGIRAEHVDGGTPDKDRQVAIKKLKEHKIDVLSNVGLFVEGLDIPEVECITLCQPTKSVARYIQQVGRGLRPSSWSDKKSLMIIDHSGNTEVHGSVDSTRDWLRGGAFEESIPRLCRYCEAFTPSDQSKCLYCMFDEAPVNILTLTTQRNQKDISKDYPIRICPPWARDVRELWYKFEKERKEKGYPLPDPQYGIAGYVESRCVRALEDANLVRSVGALQ